MKWYDHFHLLDTRPTITCNKGSWKLSWPFPSPQHSLICTCSKGSGNVYDHFHLLNTGLYHVHKGSWNGMTISISNTRPYLGDVQWGVHGDGHDHFHELPNTRMWSVCNKGSWNGMTIPISSTLAQLSRAIRVHEMVWPFPSPQHSPNYHVQ